MRAGISLPYLSDLERGKVANPSLDVLLRLSEALAVPLTDLVDGGSGAAGPHPDPGQRPPRRKDPLDRFLRRPGIAAELAEEARRSGRSGREVRADWERTLGAIEHRGRRLDSPDDWERLYRALKESFGEP